MGNQYSITVSDMSATTLKKMKDSGYKMSQVIDAAIYMIGQEGLARMVAVRRRIAALEEEMEA